MSWISRFQAPGGLRFCHAVPFHWRTIALELQMEPAPMPGHDQSTHEWPSKPLSRCSPGRWR